MAVRVFSSARITCDEGTLDTLRTGGILNGAWTAVCVFKRSGSTSDGTQFMFSASSSGSLRFGLSYSSGSALQVTVGGSSRTFGASFTISNNTWYVVAVRKASGTATPSAKLWNAGTGAVVADWTNGSGTLDDDSNLWDEIQIGNRVNDFPLNGKAGGVAIWSSSLDNTTGNTLGTGLQEWLDASPVGMWPLTQASTSDPVLDQVGDADQTAITGTSVDTGDDPAAFDLTLGGGGTTHDADATVSATAGRTAALTAEWASQATRSTTVSVSPTAAVDRPASATPTTTANRVATAAVDRPAAVTTTVTAATSTTAAVDRPAAAIPTITAGRTATAALDLPATTTRAVTATIAADATVGAAPVDIDAAVTATASRTADAAIDLPTTAATSVTATITTAAAADRPLGAARTVTASTAAAMTLVASTIAATTVTAAVTASATVAGDVIVRPNTGTISRPFTGTILRP